MAVNAAADGGAPAPEQAWVAHETFEGEGHLRNLRQLTFGGENAEAYWSFDEKRLIFQSTLSQAEALRKAEEEEGGFPEVRQFVSFIRNSERGVTS